MSWLLAYIKWAQDIEKGPKGQEEAQRMAQNWSQLENFPLATGQPTLTMKSTVNRKTTVKTSPSYYQERMGRS